MMAVQLGDSDGKKRTKCISQLTTGIKNSGSKGDLLSIVEHGEVVECALGTDEQAALKIDDCEWKCEIIQGLPGKKTASTNPSMNRQASKPPYELTAAVHAEMAPHTTTAEQI